MKNRYLLLLICTMLAGALSGCQETKTTPQEPSAKQTQEEPEEQTPEPTAQKQETVSPPAADSGQADEENNAKNGSGTSQNEGTSSDIMKEQILLEQDGITVKAVSWDPDNAALEITAENTGSEDRIIQFADTSVNHYMMEPSFSLNVSSGSQASGTAAFIPGLLAECGIQDVAQIETRILLLDALSFETRYTSDLLAISTGGQPDMQTYDDSGEVIYDQSGLKLVSKGIQEDPVFGKQWKVYISNDTGEDLRIESTSVVLNDITLDVLFSVAVPAGKKAIGSMTIFQEDLDKHQIQVVSSLKTDLHVLDMESYTQKSIISDIQLNFDGS